MLKQQYNGNIARQSKLHDKMTKPQIESETMEAYLVRVTRAALDLEDLEAQESEVGLKNLIFKGLLPEYAPYVTPIHLSRARVPLEEYKERLLEAVKIYEHTLRRTAQEVSAAYMGVVPDPFGSQMPPSSPTPAYIRSPGQQG